MLTKDGDRVILGERKLRILQAIIDDYITTAVPVGSRTISKKYSMGLSSATIRNEMSDLEELGYLDQPHTSSGRIPSDKAYRLYVDQIMHVGRLSEDVIAGIGYYFNNRMTEIEDVIKQTAKVLSELTKYTSMVLAPQFQKVIIDEIRIVPVSEERALVVIMTDSGLIKDAVIKLPEGISTDNLARISRMLTEKLKQHNIDEIDNETIEEIKMKCIDAEFVPSILYVVQKSLKSLDDRDVVLDGASNILSYPEYSDIEKARSLLELLEEKDLLYDLLTDSIDCEINISIGSENKYKEIKDCSIVTATYKMGSQSLGSIGVIGPTRMNYGSVVSLLDCIRDNLTKILTLLSKE